MMGAGDPMDDLPRTHHRLADLELELATLRARLARQDEAQAANDHDLGRMLVRVAASEDRARKLARQRDEALDALRDAAREVPATTVATSTEDTSSGVSPAGSPALTESAPGDDATPVEPPPLGPLPSLSLPPPVGEATPPSIGNERASILARLDELAALRDENDELEQYGAEHIELQALVVSLDEERERLLEQLRSSEKARDDLRGELSAATLKIAELEAADEGRRATLAKLQGLLEELESREAEASRARTVAFAEGRALLTSPA